MTKEEFEEIIKPLYLLNGKDCQFIRTALLGNFDKWSETKQCNIANVVGRSEQLKAFQKMVNEKKGYTAISDELIDKHLKSL